MSKGLFCYPSWYHLRCFGFPLSHPFDGVTKGFEQHFIYQSAELLRSGIVEVDAVRVEECLLTFEWFPGVQESKNLRETQLRKLLVNPDGLTVCLPTEIRSWNKPNNNSFIGLFLYLAYHVLKHENDRLGVTGATLLKE
jgi:hypothetical protein